MSTMSWLALFIFCFVVRVKGEVCGGVDCGAYACCVDQSAGTQCYLRSIFTCFAESEGNKLCSVGTNVCGVFPNQYCYDITLYSCLNGQLIQGAAGPCASTPCANNFGCCDIITANGLVPACFDPSIYTCFENNYLCPVNYLACGTFPNVACYLPSQYSCVNGLIEQAPLVAVKLYGIDYDPRRPDGSCPTLAQVEADVLVLQTLAYRVRIYSLDDCNGGLLLLEAIQDLHSSLQVTLGIWVDIYYTIEFPMEYAALINITETVGLNNVEAILVGSETQHRGDFSAAVLEGLLANISTFVINAGYPQIIVATDDVIYNILNSTILNYEPVIYVNQFPYWEGVSVDNSVPLLAYVYAQLTAAANGKRIVIGETGWPTAGDAIGAAVPGIPQAQQYLNDVVCYFYHNNIAYFWFEAFDEPWKPDTSGLHVEQNWGIYSSDRTPKAGISLPIYCSP